MEPIRRLNNGWSRQGNRREIMVVVVVVLPTDTRGPHVRKYAKDPLIEDLSLRAPSTSYITPPPRVPRKIPVLSKQGMVITSIAIRINHQIQQEIYKSSFSLGESFHWFYSPEFISQSLFPRFFSLSLFPGFISLSLFL